MYLTFGQRTCSDLKKTVMIFLINFLVEGGGVDTMFFGNKMKGVHVSQKRSNVPKSTR